MKGLCGVVGGDGNINEDDIQVGQEARYDTAVRDIQEFKGIQSC